MKRTHSNAVAALTVLPSPLKDGQKVLKSTLDGSHRLHVISVQDISKPTNKPIDEIEEPEEEDKAVQNRLNKSNARMLLLQLEDAAKNQIKAVETEVIQMLSSAKKNSVISIQGPVEIRCGNIMLAAKNVCKVEEISREDISQLDQVKRADIEVVEMVNQVKPEDIENIKNIPLVDLDEDFDDDDCIIID